MNDTIEVRGPCVHSGGVGVVRIEPYAQGAYFRFAPEDTPERLSPDNYKADFLTSALTSTSGRVVLCPEHILASCLLVGLTGFCVTRISGPDEFPVGPDDHSYVELLLNNIRTPGAIPIGTLITSNSSAQVGSSSHWTATQSETSRLRVMWKHADRAVTCDIDRRPTVADILAVGSSRSFIIATDVIRLQRLGKLLGAADAERWLHMLPNEELSDDALQECARHKLYDLLGDMSPLGGMPLGVLEVEQPGHVINGCIRDGLLAHANK